MEMLLNPDIWISFLTLTMLEIILGIDNIVFIALLVNDLPKKIQRRARTIGLMLALGMRVVLLLGLAWVMSLTEPFFYMFERGFSGKDLLMLAGGLFLLYKATHSIHDEVTHEVQIQSVKKAAGFMGAIIQIIIIDLVFSFDSVITAVGLTQNVPVIIAAMVVAMVVMVLASGYVAEFLEKYPTLKVLALAFILLIGVFLVAEGLGFHVPKGYIYFAMVFSMGVEVINLKVRSKAEKRTKGDVKLENMKFD